MNLKDARELRDKIKESGVHCVVPLGFGPDGYWTEIMTTDRGQVIFWSEADWKNYERYRDAVAAIAWKRMHGRRSPLEMMIDQACGVES